MSLTTHRALIPLLSALAVIVIATAAPGDPAAPASAPKQPTTKPKNAFESDRPYPEIKFDGVGLSDAIDFLRDVSHANIFMDWNRLGTAKIDRNTPVSLDLKNVPFRKVMESILAQLGTDAERPGFAADGELVVISTPAGLKAIADSARAMAAANAGPALRARLDHRLPEVKFDGVGLSDVLDFLRDVTGIPIEVDWTGLADAGVSRDVPVTVRFGDMPAGQVLRLVIDGIDSKRPMGIFLRNDKVIIGPVPAKK